MSEILPSEFVDSEVPTYKEKKVMIITGRVHPGETNGSYMM